MDLTTFINDYISFWTNNLFVAIFIHFFVVLLIRRIYKNVRIYFGTKGFVEKSNRLRRKKYNGIELVDFTKRRRKRKTNTFKELKRSARVRVQEFFEYKEEELPGITNYSYGKMFKRNKRKIILFVSDGSKKISKIKMSKSTKKFIELTNKYECLDDFVVYLHHLPEAILNHQNYVISIKSQNISIGYEIK